MTIDILTIGILIAMFVVASLTPINMGLMGFVAAFVIGVFAGNIPARDVAKSLPADLMITLLGITYLFALAETNGSIGRMVSAASRAVGGRVAAMPWLFFVTAGLLTGIGALSPAAVAILAPVAMSFARRHGQNPLVTGLLVIHGAQAGGFSPLSVYGNITRDAVLKGGLPFDALAPFLTSLALNSAAAVVLALIIGRLVKVAPAASAAASVPQTGAAPPDARSEFTSWATFTALAMLGILTLFFKLEVGFVAIGLGLLLSTLSLQVQRKVMQGLPWSEIVLILGVATYVGVLQKMGVIDRVGEAVAQVGTPALAALLILYVGAVVSAFASSAAVLGSLIPLAIPLLRDQPPAAIYAFIGSMAVASTIVDVSPFSTNGALVLASAEEAERQKLFRRLMLYGGVVTLFAPPILWVIFLIQQA